MSKLLQGAEFWPPKFAIWNPRNIALRLERHWLCNYQWYRRLRGGVWYYTEDVYRNKTVWRRGVWYGKVLTTEDYTK